MALADYEPVEERLARFWAEHPTGRIHTELIAPYTGGDQWVVRAEVYRVDDERPWATGYAHEVTGSSNVNQTSALENCETSAIGRALANAGYAPKGKRPSREEMSKAPQAPAKARRQATRAAKDKAEDARAQGFMQRLAQAEAEASVALDGETQAVMPVVPDDRQMRLELLRGVLREKYGDAHRIQTYLTKLFGESYQGNLAALEDHDIELLLVDLGLLTVENPLT